jgi:hypothetical protein
MKKPLLGPHINDVVSTDEMVTWFAQAQPSIAKIIVNKPPVLNFVQRAKPVSPNTFWVGRHYFATQPLDNPSSRAREAYDAIMGCSATRLMDAVEGYNEISGYPYRPNPGHEAVLAYFEFEHYLSALLRSEGIPYIGGSWSVYHPDYKWLLDSDYQALVRESYDFYGMHEYYAPTLHAPNNESINRHRMVLSAMGDDCPTMVITELGVDSLAPIPPLSDVHYGWEKYLAPEQYLSELKWYDGQLRVNEDRVLGGVWYCMGVFDNKWATFDTWRNDTMRTLTAQWLAEGEVDLEELIIERTHQVVLPLNEGAFLAKNGMARGYTPASDEYYINHGSGTYVAQAFRTAADYSQIFVAYTRLGHYTPEDIVWTQTPN